MIPKFLITLARKIIPEGKFKHSLSKKFEQEYAEYRKSIKSTDFSYSSKTDLEYAVKLLEKCISQGLDGDVIECGVYKGGSSFLLAKKLKELNSDKKLYALDTFEGHPYDDEKNMPKELLDEAYNGELPEKMVGTLNDVNLDEIKKCFAEEKLDNTVFMKGLFEDGFKLILDKKFCFAHVDADSYLSVKQCIEFLKDRIVTNGIILFDDYNHPAYKGCNKAVDSSLGSDSLTILKKRRAYWTKS